MKQLFVSFLCLFITSQLYGQMSPKIQSGRPGQSIGSAVVGSGTFQIQSGFDQNWTENGGSKTTTGLFNNVVRLGISQNFELSAVVNYQNDSTTFGNTTSEQNGISATHFGFRS